MNQMQEMAFRNPWTGGTGGQPLMASLPGGVGIGLSFNK